MIFYGGISFGTYETLHDWALNSKSDAIDLKVLKIPIKSPNENGDILTEWYVNSVFGMAAGLFSQFVCFPIDTAKRRMQNASLIKTQAALSDRLSMIATWQDLWKRGGLRLVYRFGIIFKISIQTLSGFDIINVASFKNSKLASFWVFCKKLFLRQKFL